MLPRAMRMRCCQTALNNSPVLTLPGYCLGREHSEAQTAYHLVLASMHSNLRTLC
jgi:hypothetical protein